ncbi:MAG: CinA family nicotinamide mononucleotide deamidase-related protein [Anaerolineales bacterium]
MPSAEIITIGTEILLGEIVDTNSAYLARRLRDLNVDVFRTSTVGDNTGRIASILRETLPRAQIIITTGGLGPTVDDPTREAVALALGVETEYHPELWQQIVERMQRFGRTPTENQKRQAYIPAGATPIPNAVGTAPAFMIEKDGCLLISLPGVPREMEYLYENAVVPALRARFNLTGLIKARVLHTAGMGESVIDEKIGDLETLTNPTVGLAAHYGQVDIRITAKANTEEEADRLIAEVEQRLRERLGNVIYGSDDDTLEGVVLKRLEASGRRLVAIEINLGGILLQTLSRANSLAFAGGQVIPHSEMHTLSAALHAERATRAAEMALGIHLTYGDGQQTALIHLLTPSGEQIHQRTYGGHPRNAPRWAVSTALDLLRQDI